MFDAPRTLHKDDFDRIVLDHAQFWDSDLTFQLHHPILIFEYGSVGADACPSDPASLFAHECGWLILHSEFPILHFRSRDGLARRAALG